MAKLSRDDVHKLAQLVRINLSEEETESFAQEITKILDYVEQLNDVDVKGLKPTNQVTGLSNVWREDELIDYGYTQEDLLKGVPQVTDRYIKVGRMI